MLTASFLNRLVGSDEVKHIARSLRANGTPVVVLIDGEVFEVNLVEVMRPPLYGSECPIRFHTTSDPDDPATIINTSQGFPATEALLMLSHIRQLREYFLREFKKERAQ